MNYYIYINGTTVGPMSEHQLFAYNINQNTSISTDGVNWRPLYTYPELMTALRQHGGGYVASEIANKKLLCGLLAIIVGGLGIQYFVLGKTMGGILTILLTCITCGCWTIITLIQGILMLCMSEEEFKRKYIDNPATMPLF
ncbi:MAG: hypothetical protein K2K75_03345 [Muribaculaceae bacterium]|nr:hypothetical protein [Muribaculaceae bacterium]